MLTIIMIFSLSVHGVTIWNNAAKKIVLTDIKYHLHYPRRSYLQIINEKYLHQDRYVGKSSDRKKAYVAPGRLIVLDQIKSVRLGIQRSSNNYYIFNKRIKKLDDHIAIAINQHDDGTIYAHKFIRENATIFNNTSRSIKVEYITNSSGNSGEIIHPAQSIYNCMLFWGINNNTNTWKLSINVYYEGTLGIQCLHFPVATLPKSPLIILHEDEQGALTAKAFRD